MRPRVLFDTSAVVAWASVRDGLHARAVAEFERLRAEGRGLVVTDYVFDEAVTLALKQIGHHAAVAIGDRLLDAKFFRWIEIDASLRADAWTLFRRRRDNPLSFTDCTSVAAMRRHAMTEVFSFDSDFDRVGMVPRPR